MKNALNSQNESAAVLCDTDSITANEQNEKFDHSLLARAEWCSCLKAMKSLRKRLKLSESFNYK